MSTFSNYQTIQSHGEVTHVLVPVQEFQELLRERESAFACREPANAPTLTDADIDDAVRTLNDPATTWHSADDVLLRVARDGLAAARKSRGLTQEQLATALGVSQPQVSRLEHNLDSTSVRVLKRIVEALAEEGGGQSGKRVG